MIFSLTCSECEEIPITSHPSTDSTKTSGDGCFLTLFDWLSRVRGEHKRANKGQNKGDNLVTSDVLNETEFLAELLYDELYDIDDTGDGNEDIGEKHNVGDGFESRIKGLDTGSDRDIEFNTESCDVTVDQTSQDEVDFILGENDTSRTPLSILKAEVLGFGNDVKTKTPSNAARYRKSGQGVPTIVPETPIFEQISLDLNTSETPLLHGSLSSNMEHRMTGFSSKAEVRKLDFSNDIVFVDEMEMSVNEAGLTHDQNAKSVSFEASAVDRKSDTECSGYKMDNQSVADLVDNISIESSNQNTPLKSLENLLVHETSPFVKKLATDKVTKRRSRRKRNIENCSETSDCSDVSDAKEICHGLSCSPGLHICNEDAALMTGGVETESIENIL